MPFDFIGPDLEEKMRRTRQVCIIWAGCSWQGARAITKIKKTIVHNPFVKKGLWSCGDYFLQ